MKTHHFLAFIALVGIANLNAIMLLGGDEDGGRLAVVGEKAHYDLTVLESECALINAEQAAQEKQTKEEFDKEHKLRSLAKAHNNNQLDIETWGGGKIAKVHFPQEGDVDVYKRVYYTCTLLECMELLYTLRKQNRLNEPTKSLIAASRHTQNRYKVRGKIKYEEGSGKVGIDLTMTK